MIHQSTNKMEKEQKSQLERSADTLVAMAPSITTLDKQEAIKEYSEFTVYQYLRGQGKNLDTAIDLIQFFRKRIEGREKVLA